MGHGIDLHILKGERKEERETGPKRAQDLARQMPLGLKTGGHALWLSALPSEPTGMCPVSKAPKAPKALGGGGRVVKLLGGPTL